MKKLLSLLLTLVLLIGLIPTASAASSQAQQAAEALYELGLFRGNGTLPDGSPNFALDQTPTRNQAVIMLVRLLGKEEEALAGNWDIPFTDVSKTSAAYPHIGYAYANGLTNGTSATTFGGGNPIRANQYITFVLRALGYESGKDFEVGTAWEFSDELGFTDGEYNAANAGAFLRGDVAKISKNALPVFLKNSDTRLIQRLVTDGAVSGTVATGYGFDAYGWLNDVHYLYDIRTFTLYAFMNYTGFDDNNGRKITGVRKQVLEDLHAMNLSISDPDYYSQKGVRDNRYEMALNCMGAAPNFSYVSTKNVDSKLRDLPEKLSEFYAAANIPALYEKYRPQYEEILDGYRAVGTNIVQMLSYFRLDETVSGEEFGIEVNLLNAFQRGSGLGTTDDHLGYSVIRTGPSNEINTLNICHEYAHGFVGDILDSLSSDMNALSHYYDPIVEKNGPYNTWVAVVNESFVRAFSTYFTEGYTRSLAIDEDERGFVMTSYIYDRIPEFETFDGDLKAFMQMLLSEYPSHQ